MSNRNILGRDDEKASSRILCLTRNSGPVVELSLDGLEDLGRPLAAPQLVLLAEDGGLQQVVDLPVLRHLDTNCKSCSSTFST